MNNLSTQIATTREQSERLLSMGMKPETADMVYHHSNSNMSEEWEDSLYKLVDEDYNIEDLVGICRTARRNGFVAGRESFQKQVNTRIELAQERIDSGQNIIVNQAIIDTLRSLII